MLSHKQEFCNGHADKYFVDTARMPQFSPTNEADQLRKRREALGWSAQRLVERAISIAREVHGEDLKLAQQSVANFELGKAKKRPSWWRYIQDALAAGEDETEFDAHLHLGKTDNSVQIKLLPTFAGMGSGGTGDDDEGYISFSRDLIENELRTPPEALLAILAEGNSMAPDFLGGDQILVDTRRRSLAQPGAFCLWDGDGHVIKYLEKVPDSDPPKVRVISANAIYDPADRLLDEIGLVGRVVWFGRRVQ